MRDTIPARDHYPTRMASAVHRTAQLSANVTLASAVREFAHLLKAADVPDSTMFPDRPRSPPPPLAPTPPASNSLSPPSALPRLRRNAPLSRPTPSLHLPERFLQRAAALHRARVAASSSPLAHVSALDDARASLARQHSTLQSALEAVLVDAIYAPVDPTPTQRQSNTEGTHSFAPATTPKNPSAPPSPLPPDIFPPLVQAVDLLGGQNHAAFVLQNAASSRLVALVRDALVADPVLPSSTIASIPPSSFTAPSVSTKSAKCLQSFPTSPIARPMHVFDNELSHVSRIACAAVFERVRLGMTAVLRRLSTLAEAVDCKESTIFEAVQQIWLVMEATLVSFVHTMLAFPSSKPISNFDSPISYDSFPSDRHSARISLLPVTPRKGPHPTPEAKPAKWQLDRAQTSLDSFSSLVQSMTALKPSIYNLEVAYSPLQQFTMMTTRLQHSWKEHGVRTACSNGSCATPLSQVLVRAVDLFMSTVRQDVCKYMQAVLGNRAGTLLQPCSPRQRRGTSGGGLLGGATLKKDENDPDGLHLLPLLPQSQMVINVIASCLSLGVAVPSIASRIGDVVNRDVILPFCERAVYALELVGGWSDGGAVFREMWGDVIATECWQAEETDENTESETSDAQLKTEKPTRLNDKQRGRLLSAIRNESGLTTRCLGRLCKRERWDVGKTKGLMENEWNAVVRLVANAKIIISQLESCLGKSGDRAVNRMILDSAVQAHGHTGESRNSFKLISLRGILQVRGISSNVHGPIVEAIQRTQSGCRMLREEVIEKGLIVLHCEMVLHCFSRAVKTLSEEGLDEEDEGGLKGKVMDFANGNGNGKGLSRSSSIFKALPMQLSDVERTSEEGSGGMNEFDEFGDRIVMGSESVTEVEIEEGSFPNNMLLEQNDWKGRVSGEDGVGTCDGVGEKNETLLRRRVCDTVTGSDKRALAGGRRFGEDVKVMDACIGENLGMVDRKYVMSQADDGVALGIRMCGEMRGKGDRDVATGARLFMDAAASVAADTLGWPVVESDYSVAEGAFHSASECRTLLFAAGML